MPIIISLIYILDIVILIFVLGHRGHLHGAFIELFNFGATLIAAFGALTNFGWFAELIRGYWSPTSSVPEGIAFGLLFVFIRGMFITTSLYLQGKMRRVELYPMMSKIIGRVLGTIKGIIVASVVLVFLYYTLPPLNLLSEPVRNPNDKIVQVAMKISPKIYNLFVGMLGADQLKFLE